ncbi:MAG: class I SAM-dependent methyltransferase [Candidatus Lokiarchaeota archaeon]|nr:class I SAM-dependent methyltransferase [Candidatus Lokiarchaeota archaeon]
MKRIKPREIEGGAILDEDGLSMEQYSEKMKKMLGGEYMEMVRRIVDEINPPEGARLLEIGPGPAWITVWLAKERPDLKIDGLEASEDMIRVATRNALDAGVGSRIRFIHGFVESMDSLEGATYDLVYSHESMHHWADPVAALREISRVLRPGGQVLIEDSRRDIGPGASLVVNLLGPLVAGKWVRHWKASIAASYTPAEVEAMVEATGRVDWRVLAGFMGLSIETT